MQQTRVTARNERGKFHQPRRDQQWHAGRNGKTRGLRRFKRRPIGRPAAEQDLPAACLPMPRQGQKIFQRPVFGWRARERLEEQRRPGYLQAIGNIEPTGFRRPIRRQAELVADFAGMQAAGLQQIRWFSAG